MAESGENGGAPHHEVEQSFMEKMAEKLHFHESHDQVKHEDEVKHEELKHEEEKKHDSSSSSSSSSDSESDKPKTASSPSAVSSAQAKIYRLFGREKPVHKVLGGGKPADVFLWRNKKISATVLGVATAIYILFELLGYHLLTLVCHLLIFSLSVLFLWSNASTFINKSSSPHIPNVSLPEKPILEIAGALRAEVNRGLLILHDIATGKDLKMFLAVIAGLWLLSIVGKSCDFLTLFYINFVLLHTVPVLYEKYEDHVDTFAEKAMGEAKKHYSVVNEKYISKIPRGPLKNKKAE